MNMSPHKKPKDLLSNIKKSSGHSPQIINKLPKTINECLYRKSCNEDIPNSSKHLYKKVSDTALSESG